MVNMKDLFKTQISGNAIVSEESLSKISHPFYEDGSPINIGDEILFALLLVSKKDDEITYKLIALKENQFDMFVPLFDNHKHENIPILKLK